MFSLETTLLGVALAVDAAIVSFAIGLLHLDKPRTLKFSRGLMVCLLFGLFQALMIWLGSLGGYFLSFSQIGYVFQLLVGVIFVLIGVKIFYESMSEDEDELEWGLLPLLLMALATSVDALAAGISLGTLPRVYLSAIEIGLITFVLCTLAWTVSSYLKKVPTQWILRAASLIFFCLGGRVIYDYYF